MCLNSEAGRDMQVVLGSQDLSLHDPNEQAIHVEEAIRHENYRETPQAVYNDIGKPFVLYL